ncbi:MAG: AAA family ATPase [Bacillota bacterium]|jgi:CO dehydrogenase maturation factor
MKLAISGKGGVGKTTIAAALVKSFARTQQLVYAIDGDPDACLATAVGIPEEVAQQLKPIAELKELINARGGSGSFYKLNPRVDDVPENYAYHLGNIRFLRMGEVKKGGSDCYCRENTFLQALVSSLLLDRGEIVVMDMGAGIEHLSRGTSRGVGLMLVVVEPNRNSVNTARNVMKMAADLGIKKTRVVGNKIRSDREREFITGSFESGEILGLIGFNEDVWRSALEQVANSDAAKSFASEIEALRDKILKEIEN